MLDVEMIRAAPDCSNCGTKARAMRKPARSVTANIWSQSSSLVSVNGARRSIAALLKRISAPPSRSEAAATSCAGVSGAATSASYGTIAALE